MAADQTLSLNIKVNTDTGALEVLGAKFKEAGQAGSSAESSFAGLTKGAGALLAALGVTASIAAFTGFLKSAITEATADEEAMRRLQFAVESNGLSWATNKQPIKDWSEAIQNQTRFSNTEALDTLGKLSTATKSVAEAQQATQVAMGLATAKGIPLNEAVDLMQGLMMGNSRATLQAHRTLGEFTDGATTAQGVLDALNVHLGNAAVKEEGAAKAQSQFKNAWSDFTKSVGAEILPAFEILLSALTKLLEHTQLAIAAIRVTVQTVYESLITLGKVAADLAIGHVNQAIDAWKSGQAKIVAIQTASEKEFEDIEKRKSAALKNALDQRTALHAQAGVKDTQIEAEQAMKYAQIHADLQNKILAMGAQTYQKKQAAALVDYELERTKIKKEITDKENQKKLLEELDDEYDKKKADLAKQEADRNVALSFQTADVALKTLVTLNDMGDKGSAADKTRAIAMLALQQAIAIGWIWVGVAKGVGEASIWSAPAAVALGAAQTAMLIASFASQVQSINAAKPSSNFNVSNFTSTPGGLSPTSNDVFGTFAGVPPPGSGISGVDSTGSLVTTSKSSSLSGVSGAGAGQVVINVGGIVVNFSADHVDLSEINIVCQKLADYVRAGTVSGVQLALAVQNQATRNIALAG